jgi:DNA adenine methylase
MLDLEGPKTALEAVRRVLAQKYLSPLRYPGGKRKLVSHLATGLDRLGIASVDRIIEPFTGGAAMSIAMVEAKLAKEAVLNDLDPLVAAFWSVVFSDRFQDLSDRVLDAKVSLAEWEKQRSSASVDPVDMAFKCLFLNRTSFSGSLNSRAGPLGGKAQSGPNLITCRWNADELSARIWSLGLLRGRIRVYNRDFRSLIKIYRSAHTRRKGFNALWYFDPPFFHKADKLYRYWFEAKDHIALKRSLDDLNEMWVLSYDYCPEARLMYRDHPGRGAVDMRYTAGKSLTVQKIECTELIVENLRLRKNSSASISNAPAGEMKRTAETK